MGEKYVTKHLLKFLLPEEGKKEQHKKLSILILFCSFRGMRLLIRKAGFKNDFASPYFLKL